MNQTPRATNPPPATDGIPEIRRYSRQLIRELGFLQDGAKDVGFSHSEGHALIELAARGVLTAGDLAEILKLDKSTTSRIVTKLLSKKWAVIAAHDGDRREKPLQLTKLGLEKVQHIDRFAHTQVGEALVYLTAKQRSTVIDGLRLYAEALGRAATLRAFTVRPIRRSDDPGIASVIQTVLPEFRLSGPGCALHDPEVQSMSTAYPDPRNQYFVVEKNGTIIGGAGFGQLAGAEKDTCEVRKMYLLPSARGWGIGDALLSRVLTEAKAAGYRFCYLETVRRMTQAQRLYEKHGFKKLKKPMGQTGHFICDCFYGKSL